MLCESLNIGSRAKCQDTAAKSLTPVIRMFDSAIYHLTYSCHVFVVSSVCPHQQLKTHLPRTPAGTRRLQVHVRREAGDRVVSTQLLLPLWKHCVHYGLQGRQPTGAQTV